MGVVRLAPPAAAAAAGGPPTARGAGAAAPRRLHPYIAMHLCGRDLEEEGEVLGGRELARTASAALAALRHVHARGRVHRDVKPSNFALARAVEHAALHAALRRQEEEGEGEEGGEAGAGVGMAAATGAGAVQLEAGATPAPSAAPAPEEAAPTGEATEEDGGGGGNGATGGGPAATTTLTPKTHQGPAAWPRPREPCAAAAAAPLCRPRIYLIDYGFARAVDDEPRDRRGRVLFHGTPDFASLRALQGCPQRPKDDLEALAYVLLQLSTGRVPWRLTTNSAAARGWTSDELAGFARRKAALFERAVAQGLVPPFVERLVRLLWSLGPEEEPDAARVNAILEMARAWRGCPRGPSDDDVTEDLEEEEEDCEERTEDDGRGEEEEEGLARAAWEHEREAAAARRGLAESGGGAPSPVPLGAGVVPATTAEGDDDEQVEAQGRARAAALCAVGDAGRPAPGATHASGPPDVPPFPSAAADHAVRRASRRVVLSAPPALASHEGELDAAAATFGAPGAAPAAIVDAAEAAALAAELAEAAAPVVAMHRVGADGAVALELLGDREAVAELAHEQAQGEQAAASDAPEAAAAQAAAAAPLPPAAAVEDGALLPLEPVAVAAAPLPVAPLPAASPSPPVLARAGDKREQPPSARRVEEEEAEAAAAAAADKENAAPVLVAAAAAVVGLAPAHKRLRLSIESGRHQMLLEEPDE